jgi:regulatory protein
LPVSIPQRPNLASGRFPLGERLWHKSGVSAHFKAKRAPRPLNDASLRELALRYVGKYATTRAKLRAYLTRKLRERGWDGEADPDPEAVAERFAELGYIDDAAYALAQSRAFAARGYGKRRLTEKLRLAGVEESDGQAASEHANDQAVEAALQFAERRRIGPFAIDTVDRMAREKWIAAMIRAGHSFALARSIALMEPGGDIDMDELRHRAGIARC